MQASVIASRSDCSGEVPGLQSVATAIGTPCCAERVERRQLCFAQAVECARQQHRHGAGRGHGAHAGIRCVFDMVGGQSAEFRHQCRAFAVTQLVGVQLDRQAERPCAASNTRRVCAEVKPMRSQNASTASTSPSACSRGNQSHTASM